VVPGTFLSASRDGLTTVVCGDQELIKVVCDDQERIRFKNFLQRLPS